MIPVATLSLRQLHAALLLKLDQMPELSEPRLVPVPPCDRLFG
jgi:hypothetical protein